MSTYKEKLDYTEETKNLIKTAITNKGVAVGEGDTFRSYAEKIDSIPAARPMGLIKIKTSDTWNPENEFLYTFMDSIESIDWSDFNKVGVTNMYQMFHSWQGKTLDIANLSTTGVTNMAGMFNLCKYLTSLDLSNFDTSQVTNMEGMIELCSKATIIWGNNWASNPKIMKFDAHTGYSWSPSYSELPKESVLDLFNKLATRDNNPVVNVEQKVYDSLTPDELAIAQNKGWTVTRV